MCSNEHSPLTRLRFVQQSLNRWRFSPFRRERSRAILPPPSPTTTGTENTTSASREALPSVRRMSSFLPNAGAAPLRRVNSADSIKSHVFLQDIAISASSVTPVRLQRPRPTAERRGHDQIFDHITHVRSTSRKRTNKSDVLSPTSLKRRSGDTDGPIIDGCLTMLEQIENPDTPIIHRSLGRMTCRLSNHGGGCWLEATSEDKSASLRLQLDLSTLKHEPVRGEQKFTLRLSGSTTKSFVFTASSPEECLRWVNKIIEAAESGRRSPPPSEKLTTSRTHPPESVDATHPRPERSIKRGGLVYAIPPKITHIILIRHGHYINAHAKGVSDADQVLSQMGRQQAELTGKYLEQLYQRSPARNQVTIYHSDLTRAVETATVLGKNFPSSTTPIPSSLLREGWPGVPFASDQMPKELLKRSEEEQELDIQDKERMEEAYNKYFAENVDEDEGSFRVIVCHANLIRYLLCRALRIEPGGVWGHFEINHCGVTRIDICRNRPLKVMAMNETGHLPHSLITSSEDHL